jgi:hypothetical protein
MSTPIPPKPISLFNTQLQQLQACAVLEPIDRGAFLAALAPRLSGEEIGDGSVAQAIREFPAGGFFKPHAISSPQHQANASTK